MSGALAAGHEALIPTPFGRLLVSCGNDAIVSSAFTSRRTLSPREKADARHPLLCEAIAQVAAYSAKRLRRFDLPLELSGTPLQVDIWRLVATLEFGTLYSYGEIAHAVGRPLAHRAVALAMARAPLALFIPAHRVVGADGRVKGAGSAARRRRMLAFEGRIAR